MLFISNTALNIDTFLNDYQKNSIEWQLLHTISKSTVKYAYTNINHFKFELRLRKEIVDSAKNLYKSRMDFSIFKNSRCNPKYWERTVNGGFSLKENAEPAEAIRDIFINGSEYATECATAIMIVYYKALLEAYGEELFNKTFTNIYLMDWDVREPLLKEASIMHYTEEILLGDRGYFNNPDFNPETSEWRGENVIVLPDSMYYGHGIGIKSTDSIIQILNSKRKDNPKHLAYFEDKAGRPDFKNLSDVYYNFIPKIPSLVWKEFPAPIFNRGRTERKFSLL